MKNNITTEYCMDLVSCMPARLALFSQVGIDSGVYIVDSSERRQTCIERAKFEGARVIVMFYFYQNIIYL